MSGWLAWIAGGIASVVVVAALIEAYVKRNRKRSLVDMRPDPAKLKRRPWEVDGVTKVQIDSDSEEMRVEAQNRPRNEHRAKGAENKETQHE
ncbi:hypothetical protein [Primorskyibacter sp. S87]|uniref:hypothetical protein n=1 Tax=Primorskyibacter sp. S87 TaxID=3415126 RepID=UPI003C797391